MSSACANAWMKDGDVPFKYGIPFGAIRKAGLTYSGAVKTILKLTLGGITYNIGKQSKEGLVVVANNYSGVSFFLPDDKPSITEMDTSEMSVYDYFVMLADTDYGNITAWDYFAKFISDSMFALISDAEPEVQEQLKSVPYTLLPSGADTVSSGQLSGVGDFSAVTTFSDFIRVLYTNLDSDSVSIAKTTPLTISIMEDGSVGVRFEIKAKVPSEDGESATEQTMGYQMYIGIK